MAAPKKELTEAEKVAKLAEKQANFKRLANTRLNNALTAIRSLESLANKNIYEWTDEQIKKMDELLSSHCKGMLQKFIAPAEAGKKEAPNLI